MASTSTVEKAFLPPSVESVSAAVRCPPPDWPRPTSASCAPRRPHRWLGSSTPTRLLQETLPASESGWRPSPRTCGWSLQFRPTQQLQHHRHLATGRPSALPDAVGRWGRSGRPTGSLPAPTCPIPSSGHCVILLSCCLCYSLSNHCPMKSWGGGLATPFHVKPKKVWLKSGSTLKSKTLISTRNLMNLQLLH